MYEFNIIINSNIILIIRIILINVIMSLKLMITSIVIECVKCL